MVKKSKDGAKGRANAPARQSSDIDELIDELKTGVAKTTEKPDTTGHLVWMVVVILIYGVFSGALSSLFSAWMSVSSGDLLAKSQYLPDFVLDAAEVYSSVPAFTSGLTLIGAAIVLILCLYSLFKRYSWKWVTYIIGLLVLGFYVNVLAWIGDFSPKDITETTIQLTPSLYHIILGGLAIALFAIRIGKRFSFLRALLVLVLAWFVLFEVQLSYGSMQVVSEAVGTAWATLPNLAFMYNLIGGVVLAILTVGGLLLLMEALAYYDDLVPAKGTVFMFIVVGIPALFLMWEAMNLSTVYEPLTDMARVSGGVSQHFKSERIESATLYTRKAYIVGPAGIRSLEFEINPILREQAKTMTSAASATPSAVLGEGDAEWLLNEKMGLRAFSNLDLELWRIPLSMRYVSPDVQTLLAHRIVALYFENGCLGVDAIDELANYLSSSSLPLTALRISIARQLVRHGDFTRAEEILTDLRNRFERLKDYRFFKAEKYAGALATAEQELEQGRKVGAGQIDLRVRVESHGLALPGALVGLQWLGYEPTESAEPTDLNTQPGTDGSPTGTESGGGGTGGRVTPSRDRDTSLGVGGALYVEEREGAATTFDEWTEAVGPLDLLTEYRRTDENGIAVFNEFIGGRYRIVVLADKLDNPEPVQIVFPIASGLPAYFTAGMGAYNVVVSF
jgi:hypothetical protein